MPPKQVLNMKCRYVSAGKFEACQPDETHYSALRLTRNLKKVIGRKKM